MKKKSEYAVKRNKNKILLLLSYEKKSEYALKRNKNKILLSQVCPNEFDLRQKNGLKKIKNIL